ncbi:MAG: DUF4956 domain-containing protein [Clostridiales Family XIII bacterium]|jgi:hypothetical protein|nr:DUF4956 domain-containing protein [Clostridiales Family XIII bacterium]
MFESIFAEAASDTTITPLNLLIAMGAALLFGLVISLVYRKTHETKTPSLGFSITLIILPSVITIIILLIGNSVARAFSLAGAFQIIRFRSAPGNPKDIAHVLFSMAVGLCCGMGFLLYGAIATLVLCGVMIVLDLTKFGRAKSITKVLKITVPENLDYPNAFDGILQKYTSTYRQIKVKTADMGSLYELHYQVTTKSDADEKAFIDALRCRNGNLNISLVLNAPTSDF